METPVLMDQPGGADARPFMTHHNSLNMDLSLRIATELHLKRLVVGGLHRVYEIGMSQSRTSYHVVQVLITYYAGRIFRNEGLSSRHNPEFTSLEMYECLSDCDGMMIRTEQLIGAAYRAVNENSQNDMVVEYQKEQINLSPPFRRESMRNIVKDVTGIDFSVFEDGGCGPGDVEGARIAASSAKDLSANAKNTLISLGTVREIMQCLFEDLCEDSLRQPTFVLEHPVETSPLSKRHRSQPGYAERFELYITGREIANAFSELTDPVDQRNRFERQVAEKAKCASSGDGMEDGCDDARVDEDFLEALESGLPPTGGLGIGIDRLVMLLTNSPSIKDVIAFPLLRKD